MSLLQKQVLTKATIQDLLINTSTFGLKFYPLLTPNFKEDIKMKEIIITNTEKLSAALDEVQKFSRVRTITVEDIRDTLADVEKRLNITKKALEGAQVRADINAQNFPSAYKYTPESTVFRAVFRGGKWRIAAIARERTDRAGHGIRIALSDEGKRAALAVLTTY